MELWAPQGFAQKPFVEDHDHDAIIWDATTGSYICTSCGLVLEGTPPQNPSQKSLQPEVPRRAQDEPRTTWADREVLGKGSLIMRKDLWKLHPRTRKLFWRLYRAHMRTIKLFQKDRRKAAFDRLLHRLSKYPAFRAAFPLEHPRTMKFLDTFVKCCRQYAARLGRKRLYTSTKIRIFLALIQPHLDAESFQDIVTRVAETTMTTVYKVRKKLGAWGTCAVVNAQQKQEFIKKAKDLVTEASIDPQTKKLADTILTRRAQVHGLISRKQPAILAAAALFVAASRCSPNSITKKRIQQLVGASYIPEAAINDCHQILELDTTEIIRTERKAALMTCMKQREKLLERRHSLRRQLALEMIKAFPEFGKILNLRNVSTLKFLNQCPSTVEIAKLDLAEIITFLKTHSRGQLQNVDQLAARLLAAARKNETVGRRRPRPGNRHVIQSLVKALEKIETQRCELETQMLKTIGTEGQVLMQTPGIGLITATIMLLSKEAPAPHRTVDQQTFLQRRLKDAIHILQRNHRLWEQYQAWFDQQLPRMKAIQHVTEQLLQTSTVSPPGL